MDQKRRNNESNKHIIIDKHIIDINISLYNLNCKLLLKTQSYSLCMMVKLKLEFQLDYLIDFKTFPFTLKFKSWPAGSLKCRQIFL